MFFVGHLLAEGVFPTLLKYIGLLVHIGHKSDSSTYNNRADCLHGKKNLIC